MQKKRARKITKISQQENKMRTYQDEEHNIGNPPYQQGKKIKENLGPNNKKRKKDTHLILLPALHADTSPTDTDLSTSRCPRPARTPALLTQI